MSDAHHILGAPLAAIDMGSNSFRIEIARIRDGRYRRLDYLKEPVRLGSGLDENGYLRADAVDRGLNTLAAMAELLALTVWLLGSTLHDPVKRWELPPNPADTQRGWRGALANARQTAQGAGSFLREKVLRRPAKA